MSKRKEIEDKVKMMFSANHIEMMGLYAKSGAVRKDDKAELLKLVNSLDEDYIRLEEPRVYIKLMTLQALLVAIIERGLEQPEAIAMEVCNLFESGETTLRSWFERADLNNSEQSYTRRFIHEKLKFVKIFSLKDDLINLLRRFDENVEENVSYTATLDQLRDSCGRLNAALTSYSDDDNALIQNFSFSRVDATKLLEVIVNKANTPTAVLQTGIRQLNALLSGGFKGGRLYTILGGSGKFKSGTLLNITDNIRMFNPQIQPFKHGRRRCILFESLENSIEETIERLYDMYNEDESPLAGANFEDIIDSLYKYGGFSFSNDPDNPSGGIDIVFRYHENLSITAANIRNYADELNASGYEVIAVVVDYLKRLDSTYPSKGDERIRLSHVSKELKNLAQYLVVPVITAMQLNRSGNSILDEAASTKADVTRFVSQSSVGNAWDIIEDSDWVCIVNPELQKSTGKLYLTFKRVKIREKKLEDVPEYFNHPFTNGRNIRLAPDVHLNEPLSIMSLAVDIDSVEESSRAYCNLVQNSPGQPKPMPIRRNDSSSVLQGLKNVV